LKLQCVYADLRSRLVQNCGDQFWVEKSLVLFFWENRISS
jgi:hypothetical protein